MRRLPLLLALPLLAACAMLVPDPGASPLPGAPVVSSAPAGGPGVLTFPDAAQSPIARRAFDPSTPALPVLAKDLRKLEDPDGALILTRGTILDDVAGVDGGKGFLHDPVLADRGGSLRLRPSRAVLEAAGKGPKILRGVLHREGSVLRLEALAVEPPRVTAIENLTVDDRLREPGERLTLAPGLHRISVEAPGLGAVEFLLDRDDGPLGVIGRDDDPSDGFSAVWTAAANDRATIRVTGFSEFDEEIRGPSLDVLVGPPVDL